MQGTSTTAAVTVTREHEGVALIHLNRPPANSYDKAFLDDLNAAIDAVRFDESVHVSILRCRSCWEPQGWTFSLSTRNTRRRPMRISRLCVGQHEPPTSSHLSA